MSTNPQTKAAFAQLAASASASYTILFSVTTLKVATLSAFSSSMGFIAILNLRRDVTLRTMVVAQDSMY